MAVLLKLETAPKVRSIVTLHCRHTRQSIFLDGDVNMTNLNHGFVMVGTSVRCHWVRTVCWILTTETPREKGPHNIEIRVVSVSTVAALGFDWPLMKSVIIVPQPRSHLRSSMARADWLG